MTSTTQQTALEKAAARIVYFAEFQFASSTQRLSSWNIPIKWGTDRYLLLPGGANYASTPDTVGNSVVGDIDIRVRLSADDWTPAAIQYILAKYAALGTGSYLFYLNSGGGTLGFSWVLAGVSYGANSSVAPTAVDGNAIWVRVTLDVNNGAAGRDLKFYTSADGVTWVQLGTTVTQAGVTSIHDGADALQVGAWGAGLSSFAGKVYSAEIRNGIGGTVVAKFDAQDGSENTLSFTGSQTGEVWTINTSGGTPAAIAGGYDWIGLGALGGIGSVEESDSLDAKSLQFTLNSAQLEWLALAVGDVNEYRGRTAKLYFCPLDENYNLIGAPELCWRGSMDSISIGIEGEEGSIILKCEGAAYGLRKRKPLRLNAAQHKSIYPVDTGLDYLTDLIAHPQLWLTKTFQKSQS